MSYLDRLDDLDRIGLAFFLILLFVIALALIIGAHIPQRRGNFRHPGTLPKPSKDCKRDFV